MPNSPPSTALHGPSAGTASVTENLETIYGPELFERGTGSPRTVDRSFSTDAFEAPFYLLVTSGGDAHDRVSSAWVALGNNALLGPDDFNQQGSEWRIAVTPAAQTRLSVRIAGAPGSALTIELVGKRRSTRFCPGDATAFASLRDAIVATPAGGSVLVCDGLHDVDDVLVDKPITLRSERRGMATLGDTDPAANNFTARPILRIKGVTSGRVRIVDLGFEMRGRGIVAENPYDLVEIDSARFVGRDSVRSNAVQNYSSDVPTARLEITDSYMERIGIGLWALGSVPANVRRSRFHRFVNGPVTYSFASAAGLATHSFGVTEDNVFSRCYNNGCIRVFSSGGPGVVLRRNHIESYPVNSGLGAIDVSTSMSANPPSTGPIAIEDNTIVSRRTSAPANTPQGYELRAAIVITTASGTTGLPHTVRRNRITDAYIGVSINGHAQVTNNYISGGMLAVRNLSAAYTVNVNFNDFTGQVGSFTSPNAGNFQCNWWGSASGPTAPPANVPSFRWTPWASGLIAANPVGCQTTSPPFATVRVCSASSGTVPTAQSLAQALPALTVGGTVLYCDGDHFNQGTVVTMPLTVRSEGPGIARINSLNGNGISVRNTAGGTVTFSDLEFAVTNAAGLVVQGGNDRVQVLRSTFRLQAPATNPCCSTGIYVSTLQFAQNKRGIVEVEDSEFHGGFRGVDVGEIVDSVMIRASRFEHPEAAGMPIGVAPNAVLRATGNTFAGCGQQCAGTGANARATLLDNTISIAIAAPSPAAVVAGGAGSRVHLERNVITGIGQDATNPDPSKRYPVVNAIEANQGTVSGRDNVVSGAYRGIAVWAAGTASLQRNDFTNHDQALIAHGSANLVCNWWGSAAGPTSVNGAPASVYTPFATTAIANRPGVSCP